MRKTLLSLAAATVLAAPLGAQSYDADFGSVTSVDGPIQDAVLTQNMGPVRLTAYWGNVSEVMTFGFNGVGYGFFGTGLDITVGSNTDTFFATWNLDNKSQARLSRLVFDAHGTTALFDRAYGFLGLGEGTEGSNVGNDFDAYRCTFILCFDRWNTLVTYRDAVGLSPNAPVGDLFKQMDVEFRTNGGILNDRGVEAGLRFDTDYAATTVPEPSTYALMAAGLAAILGLQRRRRRA